MYAITTLQGNTDLLKADYKCQVFLIYIIAVDSV